MQNEVLIGRNRSLGEGDDGVDLVTFNGYRVVGRRDVGYRDPGVEQDGQGDRIDHPVFRVLYRAEEIARRAFRCRVVPRHKPDRLLQPGPFALTRDRGCDHQIRRVTGGVAGVHHHGKPVAVGTVIEPDTVLILDLNDDLFTRADIGKAGGEHVGARAGEQ